ncbi:GatB/YqeY domain-containing protein [Candidatus Nomurabacteria bacterium]|nr:GatB/YqeY domain-containing protein [Candidatus Nomurabacteria bacterium]
MIATDIRERLKEAMKNKDQAALDTYRGVIAAFTSELVAQGKTPQDEVTDDTALTVIKRIIKQRKDAIEQFTAGGRTDLADVDRASLALLEGFMPAQLSETEIKAIAERKKEELGVVDKSKLGILVGAVMKETAGNADGTLVKQVVDELFL